MTQPQLDTLLAASALTPPIDTEGDYCAAWRAQVLGGGGVQSPFGMAVSGGLLADRLSWVFVAGYQAALRAVFPAAEFAGLACLAVSEDRSEPATRPGVVWRETGADIELNGHKSWIAACAHVDQLVVKARAADDAHSRFILVDRDAAGLTLTENPAPSLLPELSQGRAELSAVRVLPAACLDDSRVRHFARAEALHIYTAFLAMVWRRYGTEADLAERGRRLLQQAAEIDFLSPDLTALQELNAAVQALRQTLAEGLCAANERWLEDQRLIAMYNRGLAGEQA